MVLRELQPVAVGQDMTVGEGAVIGEWVMAICESMPTERVAFVGDVIIGEGLTID